MYIFLTFHLLRVKPLTPWFTTEPAYCFQGHPSADYTVLSVPCIQQLAQFLANCAKLLIIICLYIITK